MKISQVWQKQATGSLTSSCFPDIGGVCWVKYKWKKENHFYSQHPTKQLHHNPAYCDHHSLRPTFTHKEECQEPDGLITKQVNNVTWCQWETVFSLTFCSFSLTDQNIWSTRSGRRTLNTPTSGPKLCYRHTNTRHAADLTSATLHWRRRKTWEQGKQREEEKEGEWSSCSVKD